jgi:hypothetical protein
VAAVAALNVALGMAVLVAAVQFALSGRAVAVHSHLPMSTLNFWIEYESLY